MEKVLVSLANLEFEARALTERLQPKAAGATLVTLSGELGAGKTAFVQALAKAYGVGESVTSPTFVLQKVYTLPKDAGFSFLIHVDAYRLESAEELAVLGWTAIMNEPQNLIALEWPENVQGALPTPDVAISLSVNTDGSRTFSYV